MKDRPLYIDRIAPYIGTSIVKILTGIRRCGKSTIMKLLIKELLEKHHVDESHILSYRFDSFEFEGMSAKDFYQDIKGRLQDEERYYLFLDEVQELDDWEKLVNSLNSDYNLDIYVTGSNSRMMSSEIATYLTGRYVSFRIFPLSFQEYLDFTGQKLHEENKNELLAKYIKQGGFPGTHIQNFADDEIYTIVRDIYNSVIFSDIVRRNQIRKIDRLERIVKYVFSNVGNTFSATSIAKYLKSQQRAIDNETVYDYLEKLEKAYILHRCSRYDLRGKSLLKTQEKFYLADMALRYSVLGFNPDTIAASLENIVYIELCRRGYEVSIGKIDAGEIDFIAECRGERIYIQVTQELSSGATIQREYERLLQIKDNFPKYVLSIDGYVGGQFKGIKTMHVADFLLQESW